MIAGWVPGVLGALSQSLTLWMFSSTMRLCNIYEGVMMKRMMRPMKLSIWFVMRMTKMLTFLVTRMTKMLSDDLAGDEDDKDFEFSGQTS